MSSKGFIVIDRSLEDSWIYDDGEPWDRTHAWIDLILLASWKDAEFYYGGDVVKKKRGQVCRSINSLGIRWHWSYAKTWRYMKLLEKEKMVRIETNNHRTIITLENYNKYQISKSPSEKPTNNQRITNEEPTNNQRIHTIQERKKESNKVSRAFRPPTLTEVQEYADQRLSMGKPRVDPERFMDFYQSKGWMVGKSKMKDWKAAFRGWETRQREEARKSDEDVDWMDL